MADCLAVLPFFIGDGRTIMPLNMKDQYEMLWTAAKQARRAAYAPYSGFCVGAALLSEDGTVFTGCNVENAAYPVCLCAERNALGQAVVHGHRKFAAIALDAGGPTLSPCGMCRQALAEFGEMDVLCPDGTGGVVIHTLSDLLPDSFRLSPPGEEQL